jgi:hypothetical protein
MDADAGEADFNGVKENLLVEGLQDWIQLGEVHHAFFDGDMRKRPVAEIQQMTLRMLRELVEGGLFVLGAPDADSSSGFKSWDILLDDAMDEIKRKYVTGFGDRWNWVTCAWLTLTDEGKALVLKLYHAEES